MNEQRFATTVCAVAGAASIAGCRGARPNPDVNLTIDGIKQNISGAVSCSSHSGTSRHLHRVRSRGTRTMDPPHLSLTGQASVPLPPLDKCLLSSPGSTAFVRPSQGCQNLLEARVFPAA